MSPMGRQMQSDSLAARVVEVIAELGESASVRYRYGSGCIVHGRTVLTAAHLIADAKTVRVRGPDKVPRPAKVDSRFVGGKAGLDLALIEVDDDTIDLAAIGLAIVDRDNPAATPLENCRAVGYPTFAERSESGLAVRDTVDALGRIPVLSQLATGLLTLQVTSTPRPLPPASAALGESEWSGMSGAPVLADGYLLGVVSEHAARQGPSALTVVPLSALEADPMHPNWGPGVDNAPAWWRRLGATGLKALQLLPGAKTRPEPAYWATVQDIHMRTAQLLGRSQELADIAAFATGSESYRWLVGDAWAGKTALVAEAVTTARPQSVDVAAYFLSRREADADSNRFLAAVVPQLASILEEDTPVAYLETFRALWYRATERAVATGRHLLLVVDGLEEDLHPSGLPSVASMLPARVGANAHVLVTSRPHLYLAPDVPHGHPLRATPQVTLEASAAAVHLADLAQQEIADLLHSADQDLVADVLGVLTAAAGPLAIDDLAALTRGSRSDTAAWLRRIDRLVTREAARSLLPVGPPDSRRYQLAHASLLESAQTDRYLGDPEYRNRIHRWAEDWQAAGWTANTPRYLLDAYAGTLFGDSERLARLVSDVGWVSAATQAVGVDTVLADLRTAAVAAPAHPGVSAMLAATRSQAHYLRLEETNSEPGHVLRQLCLQAAELGDNVLAGAARDRLLALRDPGLVPRWTSRRASPALLAEFGRHSGGVEALAALPDGRVVSGGADGSIRLWDPAAPAASPIDLGSHDGSVAAVAVLPDGRVVSGGADRSIRLWDPAAPAASPIDLGSHDGSVAAVAVLPDGRVVSGGADGSIRLWDPAAPAASPIDLGSHDGSVAAVAVLPDGRVVSGGADGSIRLWDPAAPAASPIDLGSHDGMVALAALPDGRVVSGGGGRVRIWDPAALGATPIDLGSHDDSAAAVAVLPDGRVVSGGGDGRVRVWTPVAPSAGPADLGSHAGPARGVAVLPSGGVVSGGADGSIRLWDPAALGATPIDLGSHDDSAAAVAVLPDGRVVSGGGDGRVRIWDPAAPSAGPVDLGSHAGPAWGVAVLPDGRIVSAGDDGRVRIWDPAAPSAGPVDLGSHAGPAWGVAVLPDGRIVSAGDDGRVRIWDPAAPSAGPADLGSHAGPAWGVAVLPDGRIVSAGDDDCIRIWDPAAPSAGPVDLGSHDEWVAAVAVLPDGRVVSGGDDGTIRLWNPMDSGAEPVHLGRHDDWVAALAMLPDGRVISGGDDHRVKVWDGARQELCAQGICSVRALATGDSGSGAVVVVAHAGAGLSAWSIAGLPGG